MQRSRLSRHRSVRPKVAEKEPAGIAIAPSVASGARDAATGGACAQERIRPSFGVARQHEDIGSLERGHLARPAQRSDEVDASDPARGRRLSQRRLLRARAGDGQRCRDALESRERERLEELVETLLPNEPTYI